MNFLQCKNLFYGSTLHVSCTLHNFILLYIVFPGKLQELLLSLLLLLFHRWLIQLHFPPSQFCHGLFLALKQYSQNERVKLDTNRQILAYISSISFLKAVVSTLFAASVSKFSVEEEEVWDRIPHENVIKFSAQVPTDIILKSFRLYKKYCS